MELELLKALLKATHEGHLSEASRLLKALSSVIPNKLCSLWKVNNSANYLSIYAREKYDPPSGQENEFVHSIEGSLIGYMMSEHSSKQKSYYEIKDVTKKPYVDIHMAPERVKNRDLKRLICIPIRDYDSIGNKYVLDAVLNIYTAESTEISNSIAQIIADHFSLSLSRDRFLKREKITRDIISIYENRGNKDLASVLFPIVHQVLPGFLGFEACSIFVWDPFLNRLSLAQSTGILKNPDKSSKKSDIYYYVGEGLTGNVAQAKKSSLIPDLSNPDEEFKDQHEHKWVEETIHPAKSFMCIPIFSPSRPNEIVGVIRFINRINELGSVVDCFSLEDLDLVNHACNLIALYMEYEQSEKIRTAFAMQMGHEMLTPAVAIRGSADRLQRKLGTPSLPPRKVYRYLESIQEHANLQIALTRTVEYVWKGSSGHPRSQRYDVQKYELGKNIISQAKKLVIQIARREGLTFDNIRLAGNFPKLFVDKYAFEQVFFNLLTNAIKYREPEKSADFRVSIESHGLGLHQVPSNSGRQSKTTKGYLIQIEDWGIGIESGEEEKVFLMGYRRKNIEEFNVRGLGLGLTVVKSVLNDFGCNIWVSKLSKPTQICILLPDRLTNNAFIREPDWQTY